MYDVIIIGGSYSGLAAALQLARARRSVLIVDAGQRRNRFAGHSHGFLGQDGRPPGEIQAIGKAEVLAYPTVAWHAGDAFEASRRPSGFVVRTEDQEHVGRRLILATGVSDELPDIPGLAALWGRRAFYCPYCDGYEFNHGRLGAIATGPGAAHYALLISEWAGPGRMAFFLNGAPEPSAEESAQLVARSITIERERISAVEVGAAGVDVRLSKGDVRIVDGLFLPTRAKLNGPFAVQLGLELENGPMGPFYRTDTTKETSVRGVFACGDAAQPLPGVAFAVADGVRAGAGAHQSLVFRQE